jgi:hypothetical protein
MKNSNAPAVKREAEEGWGRKRMAMMAAAGPQEDGMARV